jgi:hypothetical protein
MKHIKLYEDFVNEKVYRMTGAYTAKGIIGKVMQSFKKEIEAIQYDVNKVESIAEVNAAWSKFHKDGVKIILDEVSKAVKDMGQVVYVNVQGLNKTWEADTLNKLNKPMGPLYIVIPNEFVINVGFMDDVDGSKFKTKLGGMMNDVVGSGEDIYGTFDSAIGENNVEIRSSEYMTIDAK